MLECVGLLVALGVAVQPEPAHVVSVCQEREEASECWLEIGTYSSETCYVWKDDFIPLDGDLTWSGYCTDDPGGLVVADGIGDLYLESRSYDGNGVLRQGRKVGHWVEVIGPENDEGIFDDLSVIAEGLYVDGKRQGRWTLRTIGWHPETLRGFLHSRAEPKGPVPEAGSMEEGEYVDGERHGHWIKRFPRGWVEEQHYAEGKKQGAYVVRSVGGSTVVEGMYVDGRKQGEWKEYGSEGRYLDGRRHGHWILWFPGDNRSEQHERAGSYVDGKREGRWTIHFPEVPAEFECYERDIVVSECEGPDDSLRAAEQPD